MQVAISLKLRVSLDIRQYTLVLATSVLQEHSVRGVPMYPETVLQVPTMTRVARRSAKLAQLGIIV